MSPPPHTELLRAVDDSLSREAYAVAIELLSAALAASPADAALHQCRGAVHALSTAQWPAWRSGCEAEREAALRAAVTDLDRAIELCPTYAEAWLNRGLARRLLADRAGSDADLTRAIELGLEPALALQAHSERGAPGDVEIVNVMRKKRGLGDAWRESVPQRATLRGAVPGPPAAPDAKPAPTKRAARGGAEATPKEPEAPAGPIDGAALHARAEEAYRAAVAAKAAGKPGPAPEDARIDVWLEGFPAPLRPAVRVFLATPRPADPWTEARALAGDERALARALVGREHPPFFYSPHYLFQAAAALRDEPDALAKVADDFLRELEGLERYRLGQERALEQVRALVPGERLSARAREVAERLSANKRYKELAGALRAWLGAGKPTAARRAEVEAAAVAGATATVAAFEALTAQVLASDKAARIKKLRREVEALDLLEAGDEPALRARIDACVERLRAHASALPPAAAREVEALIDAATSS